jgi:hypothetical protein
MPFPPVSVDSGTARGGKLRSAGEGTRYEGYNRYKRYNWYKGYNR